MALSIIIPVYREEHIINDAVSHIMNMADSSGIEVEVIICDGSDDSSSIKAIDETYAVKKLHTAKGRARQMNDGAKEASYDNLLFLHADSRLPENGLVEIEDILDTSDIKAGAFSLQIDSPNLFLKLISFLTTIRSKITRTPYGDQGIFMKKLLFEQLLGFKDIPIMEDVDIMNRISNRNLPVMILDSHIITSSRRWDSEGILYTTIRNRILSLLFMIGVSPRTLVDYYEPQGDK